MARIFHFGEAHFESVANPKDNIKRNKTEKSRSQIEFALCEAAGIVMVYYFDGFILRILFFFNDISSFDNEKVHSKRTFCVANIHGSVADNQWRRFSDFETIFPAFCEWPYKARGVESERNSSAVIEYFSSLILTAASVYKLVTRFNGPVIFDFYAYICPNAGTPNVQTANGRRLSKFPY